MLATPNKTMQKKIGADEVFNQSELLEITRTISNLQHRALWVLEYLTGGRVSEIVRRIKKRQFSFVKRRGRDFMMIEGMWTAKNPKHPKRNLPVPFFRERELVGMLVEYLDTLKSDDVLFDFSRQFAWKIIRPILMEHKERSDNPMMNGNHFFRHSRNTDLVRLYGYTDQDLTKWNGWTDPRPARNYSHLRWGDLADRMIE